MATCDQCGAAGARKMILSLGYDLRGIQPPGEMIPRHPYTSTFDLCDACVLLVAESLGDVVGPPWPSDSTAEASQVKVRHAFVDRIAQAVCDEMDQREEERNEL